MIENKECKDSRLKWERMQEYMAKAEVDACLLSTSVNLYYVTGQIYNGYFYLPVEGQPFFFVKRPNGLSGVRIEYIRRAEDIPAIFADYSVAMPKRLMLESGEICFNEHARLQKIFGAEVFDGSAMMRRLRMIKTEWEIEQFRETGRRHVEVYERIPQLFVLGMSDIQFQYVIESLMRYNESLGVFRTAGDMDAFMGSLLAGDNACVPSPYDFALGGAGLSPSIPIGANGTLLVDGMSVMVDMAGNYTAYMTDLTRTFSVGKISDHALRMHQASIEIEEAIEAIAKPGIKCSALYETAIMEVNKRSLEKYFMGYRQQARFVGHGIGLQINEAPVLSARSGDVLEPGMVIAIEPKFAVPGVGAVGVEDSYLVTDTGLEKLTDIEQSILDLKVCSEM